jgi:hypothetical protein
MTDNQRDAQLEGHIREFLRALNDRLARDAVIRQRMAEVKNPTLTDQQDLRRFLGQSKAVYADIGDIYRRIDTHGFATLKLTNDPEIVGWVEEMIGLAKVEAADLGKIFASLETASESPNIVSVGALLLTGFGAGQSKVDELTLELTAYCLTRFPPSDQ